MNPLRGACALIAGLVLIAGSARSESPYPNLDKASSASGQFVVTFTPNHSWMYHRPKVDASTNTPYINLEPSLAAISAERFKTALWRTIGLPSDTSWSGKIFISLYPAQSTNDDVVITTEPFLHYWNYRLQMPDLITRTRYSRALTAATLMEFANRQTPVTRPPAVMPSWLTDGLARQIEEGDKTQVILSAPTRRVDAISVTQTGPSEIRDGINLTRVNMDQRGLDPLAVSRQVLQNHTALTFNQLCWPTDAQQNGADGGVYLASAQLFVNDLLALPDGQLRVQQMILHLADHKNWQTAFFATFQSEFLSPLDVEKWWSLRVVAFAARDPGPLWTTEVSRKKLDSILAVPVNIRYSSNSLPTHAEISLQETLRSFEPPRLNEILSTKLRDLNLIQLRLAVPLSSLGEGYRSALSDFLASTGKQHSGRHHINTKEQLIYQLNNLDKHRRVVEARLDQQSLPDSASR